MSRSAPSWLATEPGEVYTLHFVPKYEHAAHYTGWAKEGHVPGRLVDHVLGRGARLTQVQLEAGGSWIVADVQPGTRDREQQLKERGASRRCGICKAERDYQAGKLTAAEALQAAGWDRATPHEKNLLLEMLGVESAPESLAAPEAPGPEAPQVIELRHPEPAEITPEMEALVDALIDSWTTPKPEAGYEMEAG